MSWAQRAADQSPSVQRSRTRSIQQVESILDAARRLVLERGTSFTTLELAKATGVALQTVYRYFPSKDDLLLAVIGEMIADGCEQFRQAGQKLPDPVARLHFYITTTIRNLRPESDEDAKAKAKFIVSAHWQLQRTLPLKMAEAVQPFADLLLTEIRAGADAGLLNPADPEAAAWLLNELVRSVYHHYTYAPEPPPTLQEDLWDFCLRALGGTSHRNEKRVRPRRVTRSRQAVPKELETDLS